MSRSDLDATDLRLLRLLASDGRATVRALALDVGLSEPAVHERLRRLERDGAILGYRALINPNTVGAGTVAFVSVRLAPGRVDHECLDAALLREPGILELYEVAGDDCYMLKVRAASNQDLSSIINRVKAIRGVDSTRTTIVLRTAFERSLLEGQDSSELRVRSS